ncbi:MAG: hypothetical protein COB46_03680 [Rhodospirillaceae bacterium]|nr:MAG: hypothetical protein COB46_03680 [Rhodospirillaceae bacterium]
MSQTDVDFSDSAVLIVAHGSPHSAGGTSTTRRLAQQLANVEIFGEVSAGFLAEKPFVADVLKDIDASTIYIVPNLATTGYIFEEKLPKALGLTGLVTERISPKGLQHLVLTEPVGTHPLLVKIMTSMVQSALADFDIDVNDDVNDVALVVVGHGSTKSRASFLQTLHVAAEMGIYGLPDLTGRKAIFTAFLDEPPFIQDWRDLTTAKTVIFLPFLISDGYHATRDVPLAIGFDPGDADFQANLKQDKANKVHLNGQDLIYLPPAGSAKDIAEIIFSRVQQAQERL